MLSIQRLRNKSAKRIGVVFEYTRVGGSSTRACGAQLIAIVHDHDNMQNHLALMYSSTGQSLAWRKGLSTLSP
jgi:hypothetical protein